ncbi:DNA internalization-related competence protein ComEC/Rec2 [Hydrogenophaga sp. 5NK40-0174]|uniref:DNA internalization-related competence protein ComEC/Rec2 n=1 Tax=Hydrogenophaga sp. 5NK40-0174 TaxID=3127649 RepID=UPI00310605E1
MLSGWGMLGWVAGTAAQLQQAYLWPPAIYGVSAIVALLMAGLALKTRWAPAVLLSAAMLAAACTGLRAAAYDAQSLSPELEGRSLVLTGVITGLPQRSAQGLRFGFEVREAVDGDRAVRVPDQWLLGWYGQALPAAVVPGQVWRFQVRAKAPHGAMNPHGFDRERWFWSQGIGARGSVQAGRSALPPALLQETRGHWFDRARLWTRDRILARVDDAAQAGVLAALVVGDQAALSVNAWDLFRVTGVSHLMSISGLHVTLFAWCAVRLVRWMWRGLAYRWPEAVMLVPAPSAGTWGGLMLATAYAVFSGWGVPAQRTLLMLAVMMGLRLLRGRWPWGLTWMVAMCCVVVLDPWALLQSGFWLSFVAVGMLFAADPGNDVDRGQAQEPVVRSVPVRAWRAGFGLLREQAVVTMALAPLGLMLFGQFSVVGLMVNLLAIPWVTLVVTPLALLGVVLAPLWHLAAVSVDGMLHLLHWAASFSWATIFLPRAPFALAALAVAGGVLAAIRWPLPMRMAGALLAWPALLWMPHSPGHGEFELLALDVGQGSAVLVRTASHSLLFDTGPAYPGGGDGGRSIVVPTLQAMGVAPDAVVVSHADKDHAGGAAAVAASFPDALWLGASPTGKTGTRCHAGQGWEWDGVRFEVLNPYPEDHGELGKPRLSSNAMSCVLMVGVPGPRSALLTGDMDQARELRMISDRPDLRAGLMLSPHHGSHTSSSPAFLNVVQAHTVIVQAGYLNPFRHPSTRVVRRYEARDMNWYSTPQCGAALWRSTEPLEVVCQRTMDRRYWHRR